MLNKESKIRVLENFYSLDYLFFGKSTSKIQGLCCPALLDGYVSVKGALLSVMIEMYQTVDHQPKKLVESVTKKDLIKLARESAKIARENSKTLVSSKKGQSDIKQMVTEVLKEHKDADVEIVTKQSIREKALRLAIDNLLIARTLTESKDYKSLNSWEGKLLEESYKVLRDDLAETVIMIMDSVTTSSK